jgi:Zn-dependent oligopeptidase
METRTTRKEGYLDPKTKKFVAASENAMRMISRTHTDEKYRKAAFDAMQKLPFDTLKEYVELVKLRNKFATELGFDHFYAYKLWNEEGMKMKELFDLFDNIYDKTKYAFANIRKLEKTMPGLRHPWNYGYMLSGNFTKEEDQYYQFDQALIRWGQSFSAIGINYQGGELQLDLLDRAGKYNNGFCHYPKTVYKKENKLIKGSSNFTCNVVYGQPGSGVQGMTTLFHEGGHAADRLNSTESEICINTEYPPASTAWAETQSMFLDTMFSSLEWRMRYAKNEKGESYPLELFERKVEKLGIISPLSMTGIHSMMEFEKRIYESRSLTPEKVISIAKQIHKKFNDYRDDIISVLNVPHIYSWESACSYHGYGLAELGLDQWRQYFYDKYGYIVDNPNVGKEMTNVWKLGSSKTFPEFIKIATGKKLSSKSFIDNITRSSEKKIALAKKRVERMRSVKPYTKPVQLNASIKMVHGKKVIADNKKSFEDMARKYAIWLKTQDISKKAAK